VIKAVGVQTLQDLHSKADACFSDLNDWLGAQFLQEMNRCATAVLSLLPPPRVCGGQQRQQLCCRLHFSLFNDFEALNGRP